MPLLAVLREQYEVTPVVPEGERSWVGKSMTAHTELTVEPKVHHGHKLYISNGTPADCVQIGIYQIMNHRPDYVISGINIGSNVGHGRILSSGTIGAAIEGAIDGIPSLAISLCDANNRGIDYFNRQSYRYFEQAAHIAIKVLESIDQIGFKKGIDVISVNIPFDAKHDAPIIITKPAIDSYGRLFDTIDGRSFRHMHAPLNYKDLEPGTDMHAIYNGMISITPIDISLASHSAIKYLQSHLMPVWEQTE